MVRHGLARDGNTVTRYAQWLVDADVGGDGKVVTEDLVGVPAEKVFPSTKGYNLSGGPIATALDFVRAQLATQGHLNGEGVSDYRALAAWMHSSAEAECERPPARRSETHA